MRRRIDLLIGLSLAAIVPCIYGRVWRYEFVGLDDPQYVSANAMVQAGLTGRGLAWALQTFTWGSWHPLTWISHMAAWQVFGAWAGGHHLVNVALHLANVVLLYGVLRQATGARWRSALCAALFAVHPLNVESVAWVSERKDVLSTSFWLLTLLAYVAYAKRPSASRYVAVLAAYALGLLSKPMLVTLPLALLLLDYWPLGRVRWRRPVVWKLVAEKIPLLALAAVASALVIAAQPSSADTVTGIFPLGQRVGNALNSYVLYLARAVWPAGLGAYYPFPAEVHGAAWSAAALVLASVLVLLAGRRRPYLAVGWLWFLGTLVPVIGLVQVGGHAMADRFAYVPLIGVGVAFAWFAGELADRGDAARRAVVIAATVGVAVLAVVAYRQVGCWRNEVTLYEHTLAVTHENFIIENDLGAALGRAGRIPEGVHHLEEALRIRPDYMAAAMNLSYALQLLQQQGRVESLGRDVLADAHLRLGTYLLIRHDDPGAERQLEAALRLRPGWPLAQEALARVRAAPAPVARP